MRGKYRGEERSLVAKSWREQVIPDFIREEVAPLRSFLSSTQDLIVVDIGANKGFFAKSMLQLFDISHIFMVDASPENYSELSTQSDNMVFSKEDFHRISAFHYACGKEKGVVTLYTNEDGSPLGSLYPHRVLDESPYISLDKTINVPMQTLDWLVDNEFGGPDRIDVLKIDTEGHELDILHGASNLLQQKRIDLIHFEFGIHQIEPRHFFADFYSLLKGKGYDIYDINQGNIYIVESYQYRYENFGTLVTYIANRRR